MHERCACARAQVDAASEGCNAALSSVQIISGDAALPVVLVKDGARLRLDNCGVSGWESFLRVNICPAGGICSVLC